MMKKKAFTLIELLVVIVIISLLMAIMVPCLGKARQFAHKITCTSNLRQIGVALECYQQDNDAYGPFLGVDLSEYPIPQHETPEQMLSPYLSHEWAVWNCPADRRNGRREIWYPLAEPNLPEEMLNISYVWSEPLLQGFYPGHYPENINGTTWKKVKYDCLKGALLADGNRMLNVWDWRKALDREYNLNSLDQNHSSGKFHKVNLLFSGARVESITCDEQTLKELLPY